MRPMHSFTATIHQVIREAPDTVTLVLDADVPRDYLAGQFLNIDPHRTPATQGRAKELEALKGKKERPRAYSLASAPHEPHLAITVKEEPEGPFPALLSPYLVRDALPGDTLHCSGYVGFYTLPDDVPEGTEIVHLCAGSGIVPNFGIIKDALHRRLPVKQTLLFSNRRWDDVIYRHALAELEQANPGALQVVHALTRDTAGAQGNVVNSRIGEALLRQHVRDWSRALFFICGPAITGHDRAAAKASGTPPAPKFLECMKALLLELGVEKQRIFYEGW